MMSISKWGGGHAGSVKVQRVVAEKVLRIDRPVGPESSHV